MFKSKSVVYFILLLIIPAANTSAHIVDMVEWFEGDYEMGFGKEWVTLSDLSIYNDVTVSMYDGGVVSWFYMYDNSQLTAYPNVASPLSYLYLYESSEAIFYNSTGPIQIYFDSGNSANLYLHAYNVTSLENVDSINLRGNWLANGLTFDIDIFGDEDLSQVHIVPEPTTLALFALGGLLLRKRRK